MVAQSSRIAPAVLLALACSDPQLVSSPPPPLTDATVVYDSATLANLPELSASPMWRTGRDSSATSVTFQEITGIATSGSGAIYVLDLGAGVRVFSRDGILVNSFGPKGPGPAELTNPRSIAVGGDTVFVLDNQLKLFNTTGEYIDQITSPAFASTARIAYADSGLAMQRRRFESRGGQTKSEYQDALVVQIKDVAHDMRQAFPPQSYERTTYIQPAGMGPIPLMGEVRVIVGRDGRMYVPDQEHFVIEVRSADGRSLERIVGQVPRVETTQSDVADQLQITRAAIDMGEAGFRRWLREYNDYPRAKYRPALGGLLVSRAGHVLVERRDLGVVPFNPYDARARKVWLVIDPAWTPVGYVTLPGRFHPRVFTGCTLIGYETDDVNAHLLVRYDIDFPSADLCVEPSGRE